MNINSSSSQGPVLTLTIQISTEIIKIKKIIKKNIKICLKPLSCILGSTSIYSFQPSPEQECWQILRPKP